MFVLQEGALRPQLRPDAYFSPEFFERERANIFLPHWHLVGLVRDLAKPGDYIARDLLGIPIVVRNIEGVLCAFKNVCAHRHSLIARPGRGHTPAFRCQYHGWEYDDRGRLDKLPDGRSFKGFKAKEVCLEKYRVEIFCSMIFVNLTSEGPPVRGYLGELAREIEDHFHTHEPFVTQDTLHDANWKIGVENAVESYHVPLVHPNTFGDYLPEEQHEHRLGANYSSYQGKIPPRRLTVRDRVFGLTMHLMFRNPVSWEYMHTHVFPSYCISYGGHSCELMTIEPIGPAKSRRMAIAFMPRDLRKWPVARVLAKAYKRGVNRFSERLLAEDSGVWTAVQKGSEHSAHAGVLSAREERVYHFQKYVAAKVSL